LTLLIKQGVEGEGVGTKFSEVIAGCFVCKLVLAPFFSATCRAKPLEIPHDDVRVSILKSFCHRRVARQAFSAADLQR
jgi:hypothetical protein